MSNSKVWHPSDIQGAPSDPDGDAPRRRGRIPQTAWPRILELHRGGTTLTAIAKEFDCTPSAISYILKKAEAAGMETSDAPEAETTATDAAPAPKPAPAAEAPRAAPAAAPPRPAAAQLSLPTAPRQPAAPAAEPRAPGSRLTGQIGLKNMTPSAPVPTTPPPMPAPAAPPPAPAPATAAAPTAGEKPPAAAGGAGRSEPAPVDATEGRLRETARAALVAYRSWRQTPGEKSIQTLGDAVHELRRVLARIEIDMSASRRDEQAARPIPIPWHRAARRNNPQGSGEG